MIDVSLTAAQRSLQGSIRLLADTYLASARKVIRASPSVPYPEGDRKQWRQLLVGFVPVYPTHPLHGKFNGLSQVTYATCVLEQNRSDGNQDCYSAIRHPATPGFTTPAGPQIRFSNLCIPSRYVLATGAAAAEIIMATFTSSTAIVGAISTGITRAAFESALHLGRNHSAGGKVAVLEHWSPADLLIDIKSRVEASRALTWKAAAAIDQKLPGADELAYEAKTFASEAAVTSVAEAMRVVGTSAYDADEWPFARLMEDALVLPIFNGGNQGIRKRQIQKIFSEQRVPALGCYIRACAC
ncbi:hypothetical protein EPUS_03981 [Endocarpon pusillum Z07020]|uniref:Acyl-CoA dehydrogenase/oxidase C-terminal domain-containing protein n=1 Tax=Endocarpon pusillum (strain Z07020 / HMAS-L-300199) TaxID=1263415 RepID=U1FWP6_ENDPU|nr:uncharacterized protein EPUS_03981 [Endocarpon pusillum Z07020]ERF69277.1 hypothetical protein EPUS_03981 [Endocarpon pusillum Z07020]